MRMTFPLMAGLVLGLAAPLTAAPRPDERTAGPALVGQARSWNDMVAMVREGTKSLGGDKLLAEFEKEGLRSISPDNFPSIDPSKPFALYGLADADLKKCRLVIMIPVKNQEEFLNRIGELNIKTEKSPEEGTFIVATGAGMPFPVHLKFNEGYAYFSLGGADALAPKTILPPKEVINEKDKSPAFITLKVDRMPPELKKFLVANLNEFIDQGKEAITTAESKEMVNILQSLGIRWLRLFADQGKEITFRLDADPKTASLKFDIALEAMPKTALAAAIARRPASTNAFAGLITKDAVQWMMLSAPLFHEDIQEVLVKLVTLGEKAAVGEVAKIGSPEMIALTEAGFKSLLATLKTGEMDLGLVLRGPNKDGHYTAVGGIQMQETADLEKAAKTALKAAPEEIQKWIKMDAGKLGELNLHEIRVQDGPDGLQNFFGKDQTVYIGVGKNAIYFAYGPDAKKALAETAALKPAPSAAYDSSGNPKKTAQMMKKLLPPEAFGNDDEGPTGIMKTMLDSMEKNEKTAGMTLDLTGGEKLHLTLNYSLQFGFLGGPTSFFMMGGVRAGAMAKPVQAAPKAK
ncbi:hypothetical protein [Zavarzinella formosa]|uniref:hypothetical protein n=1 Tax=Zavarzinella formosa TaxID=360055 RepID=UPI0003092402|nr:hypothetical protein [Zavarzinella formosa]